MDRRKQLLAYAIMAAIVVAGVFWILSRPKTQEYDGGRRFLMGTFARVVAIAEDGRTAAQYAEAAYNSIKKIDRLMSDYIADSEISRVNREAFRHPVQVSTETFEVLQRSVYFSKLTDGAFDVTVGPLVDLWREAADANSEPNEVELAEARSRVGYEKLILDADKRTVKFQVRGMRLDLGAIAKGYGVDKAIETLKGKGAVGGMAEIGGEVRCFGRGPKGRKNWLVGLQDPAKPATGLADEALLTVLELDDVAAATSGDYQQFVIVEGKQHSHIIDRRIAMGAEGPSSVTIIADNCTDADALATAVSVMGAAKGLGLVESIDRVEAIIIGSAPEYEITETEGARAFIRQG